MKENPNLPVVTGDMPDTWIHGYMSMPKETRISKFLQRETYNTEILNSQMMEWEMSHNSIENQISDAVENMILYDEHTFGAAITHADQHKWTYNDEFKINKSLGNYDFIEGTWCEKGNRIRNAEKIIVPLMNSQLKQLASSVDAEGKRIVVYNPLPWARSGRVNFFTGVYQKKFKIYGVKDATTGKIIPVYGVAVLVDGVVLNTIEFWTGDNPITMGENDKDVQIVKKDGNKYRITATKNKFHIEQLQGENKGDTAELIFDPENSSWNLKDGNKELQKLVQVNEVANLIQVYKPNGQILTFDQNTTNLALIKAQLEIEPINWSMK